MTLPPDKRPRAPLSDTIIVAVANLVNDAQSDRHREPSHSDIDFQVHRAGLTPADPKAQGQVVGKAKRVRAILSDAIDKAPVKGEIFVAALLSVIRAKGGFRKDSPNFVGEHTVTDAIAAFEAEGYLLGRDGTLSPLSLDTLSGIDLSRALEAYVRRARRGSEDAALLLGTGKDLLEATAAHVICERFGSYQTHANFPTLLGQAFVAVGFEAPAGQEPARMPAIQRFQRALYDMGCAVNALRNKEGTGHGRPWVSGVSTEEARSAVQVMGIVAGALLTALQKKG